MRIKRDWNAQIFEIIFDIANNGAIRCADSDGKLTRSANIASAEACRLFTMTPDAHAVENQQAVGTCLIAHAMFRSTPCPIRPSTCQG